MESRSADNLAPASYSDAIAAAADELHTRRPPDLLELARYEYAGTQVQQAAGQGPGEDAVPFTGQSATTCPSAWPTRPRNCAPWPSARWSAEIVPFDAGDFCAGAAAAIGGRRSAVSFTDARGFRAIRAVATSLPPGTGPVVSVATRSALGARYCTRPSVG